VGCDRRIRNIALIGFMGVGKSSVGRLVAAHLDFEFVDTDRWIEQQTGKPISRIFAEDGEAHFRTCERRIVEALATRERVVAATGGGLAATGENLVSLKRHAMVVCLWASPEAIWERVRRQRHRPLLETPDPLGRIRELLAQREPYYRQADVLINTEGRPAREVAHQVIAQFRTATSAEAP
jgi:shikimate kinase